MIARGLQPGQRSVESLAVRRCVQQQCGFTTDDACDCAVPRRKDTLRQAEGGQQRALARRAEPGCTGQAQPVSEVMHVSMVDVNTADALRDGRIGTRSGSGLAREVADPHRAV